MEAAAGGGITVSWGVLVGLVTLVCSVGPGFYWLGQLASRISAQDRRLDVVDRQNETVIKTVGDLTRTIAETQVHMTKEIGALKVTIAREVQNHLAQCAAIRQAKEVDENG